VTFDCGSPLIALSSSRHLKWVFVLHDISETYTMGLEGTFHLSKRSYIYSVPCAYLAYDRINHHASEYICICISEAHRGHRVDRASLGFGAGSTSKSLRSDAARGSSGLPSPLSGITLTFLHIEITRDVGAGVDNYTNASDYTVPSLPDVDMELWNYGRMSM
jgi:hypothetical protein